MNENLNEMIAASEGIVPKPEQQQEQVEVAQAAVTPDTAPELSEEVKAALAKRRGEAPAAGEVAEESFADRFAERAERDALRDRMETAINEEKRSDRLEKAADQFSAEILRADSFASLYSILDTAKERGLLEIGGVKIDEMRADFEELDASSEGPADQRFDKPLLAKLLEKTFPLEAAREKIIELYEKNSKEADDFEALRAAAVQQGGQQRRAA